MSLIKEERRFVKDRREFHYTDYFPERRSVKDRRLKSFDKKVRHKINEKRINTFIKHPVKLIELAKYFVFIILFSYPPIKN